jgi:hypothetical protein
VAIEPISNYIILEKYANGRSDSTCNQALTETLGNLSAKIVQGTSDEGKGLINHVTKGFTVTIPRISFIYSTKSAKGS